MSNHGENRVLANLIADQADRFGDQPFLFYQDKQISFAGIYTRAGRMAAGLRDIGVTRGEMVSLMLPNCPEFIALSFGITFLGAIEVPINIHHKGDILGYMIKTSNTRVLVVDTELISRIAGLGEALSGIRQILIRRAPGDRTQIPDLGPATIIELSEWDNLDPVSPDPGIKPKDPYCLLFTSGTTGPSKGSLLPHNYAFHTANVLTDHLEIDPSDVIYTFMPLFHNNAKLAAVLPALLNGCQLILAERFSLSRFWEDMLHYNVTLTNLIGGLVVGLLKQEEQAMDRTHSVRRIFTAAAGREESKAFEERFGIKTIEGYGMTEINIVLLNSMQNTHYGSIGQPTCGFNVEIHDEQDLPVPAGTAGEIVVRPRQPYTMQLEYYGMPEKTIEACHNLWFHTGDLGHRDAEGHFYFIDRDKDSIRRMGENISSQELERIVNEHPAILESAAIAVPSEYSEDEVKLLIVLKKDAGLSHAELLDYCRNHMAGFMVPRYLEIRNELPRNPTGRIEKYKLRQAGLTADTWDSKGHE